MAPSYAYGKPTGNVGFVESLTPLFNSTLTFAVIEKL